MRLWNTALGSVLFCGILVLVGLIGQRHPVRLDLTESKRYSISEQSRKILRSLEEDVHITAFFQEATRERSQARRLLETYRYHSDRIHYQLIDPDRHPSLARRYNIRSYGTLVLEGSDKSQTVHTADEQSITNAILKLAQEENRVVYLLSGHGERDMGDVGGDGYSSIKAAMERENLRVATLNLMAKPEVPEDAALVLVAGPQEPLLAVEIGALRAYLEHDGRVMVLLEPSLDAGLRDFLGSYGIVLSSDIIVDTMSRVFNTDYLMPVLTDYGFHPITDGFNVACFLPTARSVSPAEVPPEGSDPTALASTSPYSWATRDRPFGQSEVPEFQEGNDRQGPITVAVIAAIAANPANSDGNSTQQPEVEDPAEQDPTGQAYLAVFGDCDFVSNRYLNNLQGNADLFLNSVNFLTQQQDLMSIERPEPETMPLTLSRSQGRLLFWVGLFLMPAVVLGIGLTVFQVRRKHR
jgi:ABC-type uncharacterized transport system involved in gliding motility auxiliary subunit